MSNTGVPRWTCLTCGQIIFGRQNIDRHRSNRHRSICAHPARPPKPVRPGPRPSAAYCDDTDHIHGTTLFGHHQYVTDRKCYTCGHHIVRVSKTENLGPSDVGYEYVTRHTITEWP